MRWWICKNNLNSSAYPKKLQWLRYCFILFMWIMNSRGPRWDPWGVPEDITVELGINSLISTYCNLLVKCIHFNRVLHPLRITTVTTQEDIKKVHDPVFQDRQNDANSRRQRSIIITDPNRHLQLSVIDTRQSKLSFKTSWM